MTNSIDERLKKSMGSDKSDRAMQDRAVTQDRELSDNDRVSMFRQSFWQSALPDLPEIPGYHVCWLTTTNPRDTIQARIRLGYEPITPKDVPGWDYATLKTGEYQGLIGVNEMLAFKLPTSLYQRYMAEAHHKMPMEEEGKLAETADLIRDQARAMGSNVMEGDGTAEMRRHVPTPIFT